MAFKVDHVSSKLGTKIYWDEHYTREISNFELTGEEGEVWFGKNSEIKIVKFCMDKFGTRKKETAIIELGTGNASLLRKLREKGFTQLCGVDYSEKALELSRRTCAISLDSSDEIFADIRFELVDLTSADRINSALRDNFDCVIDKGTWDAISLTDTADMDKRLNNYRQAVIEFMKKSQNDTQNERYFIIVSCNFALNELKQMFECTHLHFFCEFSSSSPFMFGGKAGNTFTGAVFNYAP